MKQLSVIPLVFMLALGFIGCQPQAPAPDQSQPGAQPGAQPGTQPGAIATPGAGAPAPSINTGTTEAEMGVAFYPGAVINPNSGSPFPEVKAVILETTDPFQSVVDFYTQKIGKPVLYQPNVMVNFETTAPGSTNRVVVGITMDDKSSKVEITIRRHLN